MHQRKPFAAGEREIFSLSCVFHSHLNGVLVMPSYTNRFHECREQALDLIHQLLVLDARCQDDAVGGDEELHTAAVVAQYQLDYALERARAATVVPTRSCGPATPRDHIESRDAYERFLQ
ncbi:MAG: hypothetical protein IAF58_06805, partial [Leptolyngbya sp.]|nr:hypothetical protein [Candidatus Melainabacteria bacterium]